MTPQQIKQTGFPRPNLSGILQVVSGLETLQPVSMDSATDNYELTTLLSLVADRDKQAFESLYNLTVDRLFGLALRITRSHHMADDVLSDVYLQVWNNAEKYSSDRGSVMAWLSIICRSRALDKIRNQQRFADKEGDFVNDQLFANEEVAQDLLSGLEENSALHQALKSLDEESRQLIALAYFRDYSHNELSRLTGKPVGTVKTQIRRAIIKLNQIMAVTADKSGASYE